MINIFSEPSEARDLFARYQQSGKPMLLALFHYTSKSASTQAQS
jgi:hypothetical protein